MEKSRLRRSHADDHRRGFNSVEMLSIRDPGDFCGPGYPSLNDAADAQHIGGITTYLHRNPSSMVERLSWRSSAVASCKFQVA